MWYVSGIYEERISSVDFSRTCIYTPKSSLYTVSSVLLSDSDTSRSCRLNFIFELDSIIIKYKFYDEDIEHECSFRSFNSCMKQLRKRKILGINNDEFISINSFNLKLYNLLGKPRIVPKLNNKLNNLIMIHPIKSDKFGLCYDSALRDLFNIIIFDKRGTYEYNYTYNDDKYLYLLVGHILGCSLYRRYKIKDIKAYNALITKYMVLYKGA